MGKGYIVLDLNAAYGGTILVPGEQLSRKDKAKLELHLGTILLQEVAAAECLDVHNIRPNPSDPPDVLFQLGVHTAGLELAELVPENRLEKDAILRDIKREVVASLSLK